MDDPIPETILVPTDGSAAADRAAAHAVAMAEETDGTVHALYVVHMGDVGFVATPSDIAETKGRLESKGQQFVDAVATRAREAGVDCVTAVTTGIPDDEIVAYAHDHGVDLIVMGKRGRSDPDKTLVGSTASRVIGRADVPVRAV